MNEQKAESRSSIEWTRVYGQRGYTWNPIGGCQHDCKWQMPNGDRARCYAKTLAEEGMAKRAYDRGFEHHYWRPHTLSEPLKVKEPAGIFLDSMSDIMGQWVPEDQIKTVLTTCKMAHWHTFQLLTKTAPRLLNFDFPPNVWLGVSSPPDYYRRNRLTPDQKNRMLETALKVLTVKMQEGTPVRFMSFEPLSWDVSRIVMQYPHALNWAIIGAASNGNRYYPPDEGDLRRLLDVLNRFDIPVFFKGNLKSLPFAAVNWRQEFPGDAMNINYVEPVQQLPMFEEGS